MQAAARAARRIHTQHARVPRAGDPASCSLPRPAPRPGPWWRPWSSSAACCWGVGCGCLLAFCGGGSEERVGWRAFWGFLLLLPTATASCWPAATIARSHRVTVWSYTSLNKGLYRVQAAGAKRHARMLAAACCAAHLCLRCAVCCAPLLCSVCCLYISQGSQWGGGSKGTAPQNTNVLRYPLKRSLQERAPRKRRRWPLACCARRARSAQQRRASAAPCCVAPSLLALLSSPTQTTARIHSAHELHLTLGGREDATHERTPSAGGKPRCGHQRRKGRPGPLD